MTNYHELKFKADPFMWAYEEFKRDPNYWLKRAKNGKGLIKEIAEFVIKNGNPQQERECPMYIEKRARPPIVTSKGKIHESR